MTTTVQTSVISTRNFNRTRSTRHIYQVVVNAEDGNYQEYEIEARSEAEAEAKANDIAHETMTDITYIEIYKLS